MNKIRESSFIEIKLARPQGFCAGVRRAIDIVEQVIKIYGPPIYVKHELVHNDYVLTQLSKKGVIFTEYLDTVPNGSVLVFSAHGVSKKIKEQAQNKKLVIFDATCPLVKKVHMEVDLASKKKMEVIVIGHSGHPEVEGTMGQYYNSDFNKDQKKIHLIESQHDAWSIQIKQPDNLYYVTQTTLSIDDTLKIIYILRYRFPNIKGPKREDICYATFNRQNILKKLALLVELIFVVGSRNSSNSNRLLELALKIGKNAYLVDNPNDINIEWLYGIRSIGITAGASSPDVLVNSILKKICKLSSDNVLVEEIFGEQENVFFGMPKALKN